MDKPGCTGREESSPVLVVIVNYRTGELVVNCLRSLKPEVQACPGATVVVVDNASGDGSADAIAAAIVNEGWSDWARLARAPVNGGFAYGNNFAVQPALRSPQPPSLVWLLNPDTQVRGGALRELAAFLDDRPEVGIAGSGLDLEDGTPWPVAFRFPSFWSELANGLRLNAVDALLRHKYTTLLRMGDRAERVDWLPGASMMVRREVFDAVGLMDEGYFLYFEETDFCLQAARAGWQCWYVPQSRVMHIAGQSSGITGEHAPRVRRPNYWFESRRRYWLKNHGWLYAAATDLVWTISYLFWMLRNGIQRKASNDPPRYLRDFLRNSALFHTSMPANPRVATQAGRSPA